MSRWSLRRRTSAAVGMALLSVLAAVFLSPLVYCAYVSLQLPEAYGSWVGLDRLTLENYLRVLRIAPLARWYLNTVWVTLVILAGNLVINTLAGYALARLSFPGRDVVFLLVLGMMIVPLQTYLIPLYIWVARVGWLNSYIGLTVPFLVLPFFIFVMRQFFLTLPRELEDAAAIDGLGYFGTFLRVILPNAKAALTSQAILSITWTWNSFVIPVTFVNDPRYFVLTVGLNTLKDLNFDWPTVTMAGVVYLTLPVILGFALLQRYIVQALVTTGLK